MLILNFSHPLTDKQQKQIEILANTAIEEGITIPVQIDQSGPLEPQISTIVDVTGLTLDGWQKRQFLINPLGYAPAAFVLLAELHGLIGYFPSLIRLHSLPGSRPTIYEVAELINLQAIREEARLRR
jgi:hypothetical protein